MLASRSLTVIWGDTELYWNWIVMPDSRFPEVAQLRDVCWLEIRGIINTIVLSPNTQYAAYAVFKLIESSGFQDRPVELSVVVEGGHSSTRDVCLEPNVEGMLHPRVEGLQRPSVRTDGWLEIEMGEFFNPGIENEEVQMNLMEIQSNWWKSGLLLEGIEVRPK
ncbi:hypothetical protein TSUD_33360 [Trifolium subterraneum]|uniref:F-box domain-containing protein n=1 Tax=Trifolium subterraneum TaxID=3900 RepID=A0A2Z6MDT4_TRISU|nr:hypothetical protein TSUD_33360 [Trifolium subterraneum]